MDRSVVPLARECPSRSDLAGHQAGLRLGNGLGKEKNGLPGLVCEGLGKMSERTRVLVILQIRIKAAITLCELSISPANDEVVPKRKPRRHVGENCADRHPDDLPGGERNTEAWIRKKCASWLPTAG